MTRTTRPPWLSGQRLIWLCLVLAIAGFLIWQCVPVRQTNPSKTAVADDRHPQTGTSTVTLYFGKQVGNVTQSIPVTRRITLPADPALRVSTVVNALLDGPSQAEAEAGCFSELSGKVTVLSVKRHQDGLVLNLSKAFVAGGGSDSMTERLDQLIRTVLSAEPDRPVYLHVDGQPLEVLGGEGIEVPQPLRLLGNAS
jgi:spore germination protein GerM